MFRETSKYFPHIFHAQASRQPPPRILTFADIISEAEIAALLAAQNEEAFQQSKDQGDYDSFGISEVGLILRFHSVSLHSAQLLPTARALPLLEAIVSSNRTSQTAWCQDACKDTPSYTAVTNRSLIAILKRSSSAFIIPSLDDYNKMLWITAVKLHKHPNIDAGRLGFFSV